MTKYPFSTTECCSDTRAGENFKYMADCNEWCLGNGSKMGINWALLLKDVPIKRVNMRKGNVGRPKKYTDARPGSRKQRSTGGN